MIRIIKIFFSVLIVTIISGFISFKLPSLLATGTGAGFRIFSNATSTTQFQILDPDAITPVFTVDGSGNSYVKGNLGIGTTSPSSKLDVAGAIEVKNGVVGQHINIYNTYTDGSSYEKSFLGWSGNVFKILPQYAGANNWRKLRIATPTETGYIDLSDNQGIDIKWSTYARLRFLNLGLDITGNTAVTGTLSTTGTTNLATGSGNVGIGTTTPSAKLQVIGNTKLDGNITFTNGAQTYKSYSLNVGAYGDTLTLNLSANSKIIPTTNNMDYRVYNNHTWNASMYSGGGNLMGLINEYNGYQQYAWGLANNRIIFTPFNSGGVPSRELARFNISSPTQKGLIINASSTQSSNMFEINSLPSIAGGNLLVVTATGTVGIGTTTPTSKLHVSGLVEYADNDSAIAGGLTEGAFYRTGDLLKIVH